ncbi:MAG: diacylglycerol kinase family lipid kinase [Elusimicrobia bacterium]|nr:diacylglycerol kinase family lipid kinase [Elusimicrobiota bacterium]
MSYFFIINPNAGHKRKNIVKLINGVFSARKMRYEIEFTTKRSHARELAAKAVTQGFSDVVAVGGDGTIRETASALVGHSQTLGIIPCGSGNGLARNLYIPLDAGACVRGLLDWHVRAIDAGLANGELFLCSAGVGLDAEIARDFNARKGGRGILPYIYHGALQFFKYRPVPMAAAFNSKWMKFEPLLAAVMNGRQFGGGAQIAPDAYLDDGLLDLAVVKKKGFLKTILTLPDLFNGRLASHPELVSYFKAQIFELHCLKGTAYHLDGEDFVCDTGLLKITVLPRALKVKAPPVTTQ